MLNACNFGRENGIHKESQQVKILATISQVASSIGQYDF
jgi:hypothetical protein